MKRKTFLILGIGILSLTRVNAEIIITDRIENFDGFVDFTVPEVDTFLFANEPILVDASNYLVPSYEIFGSVFIRTQKEHRRGQSTQSNKNILTLGSGRILLI